MSAKYISSQEIEKLFLDGDYRIYVRQNKKWRWTGFEKMPRGCEQDMYTDLLWQNIYVDWLAILFYPDSYILLNWCPILRKLNFYLGFPRLTLDL